MNRSHFRHTINPVICYAVHVCRACVEQMGCTSSNALSSPDSVLAGASAQNRLRSGETTARANFRASSAYAKHVFALLCRQAHVGALMHVAVENARNFVFVSNKRAGYLLVWRLPPAVAGVWSEPRAHSVASVRMATQCPVRRGPVWFGPVRVHTTAKCFA